MYLLRSVERVNTRAITMCNQHFSSTLFFPRETQSLECARPLIKTTKFQFHHNLAVFIILSSRSLFVILTLSSIDSFLCHCFYLRQLILGATFVIMKSFSKCQARFQFDHFCFFFFLFLFLVTTQNDYILIIIFIRNCHHNSEETSEPLR